MFVPPRTYFSNSTRVSSQPRVPSSIPPAFNHHSNSNSCVLNAPNLRSNSINIDNTNDNLSPFANHSRFSARDAHATSGHNSTQCVMCAPSQQYCAQCMAEQPCSFQPTSTTAPVLNNNLPGNNHHCVSSSCCTLQCTTTYTANTNVNHGKQQLVQPTPAQPVAPSPCRSLNAFRDDRGDENYFNHTMQRQQQQVQWNENQWRFDGNSNSNNLALDPLSQTASQSVQASSIAQSHWNNVTRIASKTEERTQQIVPESNSNSMVAMQSNHLLQVEDVNSLRSSNQNINHAENVEQSKTEDRTTSTVPETDRNPAVTTECNRLQIDVLIPKQQHVCTQCGRSFRYPSLLERHLSSHSTEKKIVCQYPNCNKRFQHKYHLSQHVRRVHEAVKKFKCNHPGCGKSFVEKSNLKVHQRSHTGEKPYVCTYCTRRFSMKTNLTAHERIHSGEKPFECTFSGCQRRFARKAYLTQHLKVHGRDDNGGQSSKCDNQSDETKTGRKQGQTHHGKKN